MEKVTLWALMLFGLLVVSPSIAQEERYDNLYYYDNLDNIQTISSVVEIGLSDTTGIDNTTDGAAYFNGNGYNQN